MITEIFKKMINNIKMKKRNNKILKFGLFPNIFNCLDETMNKESKIRFCNYLKKYKDIKKWSICSDYCLDDKNKNSNVYTFALFPVTKDISELKEEVVQNIKSEIKKSGNFIPESTLNYLNNNDFFIFNFVFPKDFLKNYFSKNFNKESEISSIEEQIKIIKNNWKNDYKDVIVNSLNNLIKKMKERNFNLSLYKKILLNSFLAAYLCTFLQRQKNIETYSWLSDRDNMTTYGSGIINALYLWRKEEIKKIIKIKFSPIEEGITILESKTKPFYDELIRVPDYFCGTLASLIKFSKNKDKYIEFSKKYDQIIMNVLNSNKNIVTILFEDSELYNKNILEINCHCIDFDSIYII
ncbi:MULTISPECIES: hypothetical protein [Fusobacterium]|uniref:hypothetical protein n=1 Tax=Fusobacterium TaxID=848 RepID=UPI0030D4B61A